MASLQAEGINTWQHVVWQEDDVIDDVRQSDIVVAIGGDGAMLRAARVCAPYDVPVLGLNMGRLGFLTEVASPADWEQALPRLLAGDFWIEQRMMVSAYVARNGVLLQTDNALNDVVVSGESAGLVTQLDLYIDGHWTTTYNADAVIISTPTGSTAYALAAGGPILPPDLRNILVLPTAAHLSMDRPIVLSEGSEIAIRTSPANRSRAIITLDGMRLASLEPDDTLYVRASHYYSRFVRMRERNYFYRSLLDRLEPRVNRAAPRRMRTIPSFDDRAD